MSRRYAVGLSALFCLFLGGMLVLHLVLPDREKSEVENRTLQQVPSFSIGAVLDGSFMEETEDYIADQFPGRDGWTEGKARAEQLLGKREFHGVYLCGDRLIAKVEEPDQALLEKDLSYVKALAEKTDIPVYLGLIPSAAEIWKDRLPAGAQSLDQAAFIHSMTQETGLPTVDYLSVLQEHAGEEIFYRTDHHWTSLGAYYGYTAVLKALGMEPLALSSFTPQRVTEDFNGTLYSRSGVHWLTPDAIDLYVKENNFTVSSWRTGKEEAGELYDLEWLESKDKYSLFLGGNQPLCVIRNPQAQGGKILLVRDSYADSLAPFLATAFSEVHLVDLRHYKDSLSDYAKEQGIDAILLSYSVPNFLEDTNLGFLAK